MSNDPAATDGVPESVQEWLAGLADEQGLSEEELLARLVAVDGTDGDVAPDRVEELESDVSSLQTELDEKIQDVRERVIQVKREADAKSPADHDHPSLTEEVARVEQQVESLGRDFVDVDAAVDRLDEEVEAVEDRLAAGFDNYEAILEYLVDATDDLLEKSATLARATVDVKERVDRLSRSAARRAAADDLRGTALRHGVSSAKCETCGDSIDLALLASPECPHCASTFTELEPKRAFFRSSVLHTGERPAIEGEVEGESAALDSLVAEEAPEPPDRVEALSGERWDGDAEVDAGKGSTERDAFDGNQPDPADGPVAAVSGIGDAYAERLEDVGVETVGDLAGADVAALADRTGIPAGRLERLVSRARDRLEGA